MALSSGLQNYLSDLGLFAPEQPSIEFVQALQATHVARYSFNSLAVVLGEDVVLDLDDISQKIVTRGLGGYCFEHNKLTFELLKALGYDVQLKLARVLNNNLEREAGRTHRVTLLSFEGVGYLVDTGFGGNGPVAPLRLDINTQQVAGLDHYRVLAKGKGEYDLQVVKGGDYFTLYRFDNATYTDADCELGHFYSHKHSSAVFLKNLMVTLKKKDQVIALVNAEFTTRDRQGERKVLIESPESLGNILSSEFDIVLDAAVIEHLFIRFLAPMLAQNETGARS
ncbi:arylamine N-acetyltransferase [Marinomonas rhizomae]|uniref:N-hydroxyarylamine O-acetyltransferase n=1 Tax=Marinomonas rhizomae TaxID=491948 RepID=A0A366J4A1_9GAMM|nr:arylamine N-acetyltransferase [Marinomonas rhizomae]RBP81220.1 N-hydroxyarylamine O-acetyltransferase [Marinomonas rhizomae]RNF72372.1 arylamine N-acetyltransferase [Marinomonas rhizomae]